mmetsp:Transcript_52066/g.123225  ORF Transcript_52066/g.123225 Transcript_52066/m.123225 type:complete len:269 (-) Transcript_52066:4-810(-)
MDHSPLSLPYGSARPPSSRPRSDSPASSRRNQRQRTTFLVQTVRRWSARAFDSEVRFLVNLAVPLPLRTGSLDPGSWNALQGVDLLQHKPTHELRLILSIQNAPLHNESLRFQCSIECAVHERCGQAAPFWHLKSELCALELPAHAIVPVATFCVRGHGQGVVRIQGQEKLFFPRFFVIRFQRPRSRNKALQEIVLHSQPKPRLPRDTRSYAMFGTDKACGVRRSNAIGSQQRALRQKCVGGARSHQRDRSTHVQLGHGHRLSCQCPR